MKCPKCGYLGFESGDRCRNCGYEFSLAPALYVSELSMRGGTPEPSPLDDLTLVDAASAGIHLPADRSRSGAGANPSDLQAAELPLFADDLASEEPLITRASAPRTPLAVRRATPDVPRLRGDLPRTQQLSLAGSALDHMDGEPTSPADRVRSSGWAPQEAVAVPASLAARIAAAAIDGLVVTAIDLAVIYFTMQICGVTTVDLEILPKGPLVAFLVLQNGGYFIAFTAGGQTLGKMAMDIKVVAADSSGSPTLERSMVRTFVWAVLAVPAGLGFVTTLFSHDHRGLHDRFAGTRVVRARA